MIRLLAWLLAGFGVYAWLRRARRPARQKGRPRTGGRMVRDRVCETFLPEAAALRHQAANGVHYFCSAGCREKFLAGKGGSTI